MANVLTNNIAVPRIARNKRIYSGNTAITRTIAPGNNTPALEWAEVTTDETTINRDLIVEGDVTVTNLTGNPGDTVIVNENGTLATVREIAGETPAGTIDGNNVTFTIAHLPAGGIRLFKNGQRLKLSIDYTITDQEITLSVAPVSDGYEDILLCDYSYLTYSPGALPVPEAEDQVNWTPLTRGAAAEASGYDLQICRVGKQISISGIFQFVNGSGVDSIIATISSATIALGLSLTRRIYWQFSEVSALETNRGLAVYVDTFDPTINPVLRIKARDAHDAGVAYISITFNAI